MAKDIGQIVIDLTAQQRKLRALKLSLGTPAMFIQPAHEAVRTDNLIQLDSKLRKDFEALLNRQIALTKEAIRELTKELANHDDLK